MSVIIELGVIIRVRNCNGGWHFFLCKSFVTLWTKLAEIGYTFNLTYGHTISPPKCLPNLSTYSQENATFEAKKRQPQLHCRTLVIIQLI